MSEWTPEPWELHAMLMGESTRICKATGENWQGCTHIAETDLPADARRAVACVNACKGIPTEALEEIGDPDTATKRAFTRLAEAERLLRKLGTRDDRMIGFQGERNRHIENCWCKFPIADVIDGEKNLVEHEPRCAEIRAFLEATP